MKIKLDENLPAALGEPLAALGHDVDSVIQEGIAGRDDGTVWDAAQKDGRLLITQDLDFSDLRRFQPGRRHGILLIRLRAPGRLALFQRTLGIFQSEDVASWGRCHVVATELKIRIRRPPE